MRRLALPFIMILSLIVFSCVDSGGAPATPATPVATSETPAADAAQPEPASSIADLGGPWRLVEFPEGTPVPDDVTITLTFDGSVARGSSGCNSYNGAITEPTPGKLESGLFAGTQKFCEGDVMNTEGEYLRALGSATGYALDDGRLVIDYAIDDGDPLHMVFEKTE